MGKSKNQLPNRYFFSRFAVFSIWPLCWRLAHGLVQIYTNICREERQKNGTAHTHNMTLDMEKRRSEKLRHTVKTKQNNNKNKWKEMKLKLVYELWDLCTRYINMRCTFSFCLMLTSVYLSLSLLCYQVNGIWKNVIWLHSISADNWT